MVESPVCSKRRGGRSHHEQLLPPIYCFDINQRPSNPQDRSEWCSTPGEVFSSSRRLQVSHQHLSFWKQDAISLERDRKGRVTITKQRPELRQQLCKLPCTENPTARWVLKAQMQVKWDKTAVPGWDGRGEPKAQPGPAARLCGCYLRCHLYDLIN